MLVKHGKWQPPRRREAVDPLPAEEPTFWAFARKWFEGKEHEVSERTQQEIEWALQHLIWFGAYRLSAIDAELVDDYKTAKLMEGTLSATSVNRTLQRLAEILDRAVAYKYLAANPARGKDRRVKVKRPKRIWLELDEVKSLLAAAGDYRAELATLILAGLRISELGALRWRSVDLAAGRITVEESKTAAGEGRIIDLTPLLLAELKLHRAAHAGGGLDDLVFPTSNGRARSKDNSRGRLLTILKRANIARAEAGLRPIAHITNHTMRRTFMSLMYEAGATPPEVMDQAGHVSAAMALEVYAKKLTRSRETGARMDALVDWAQTGTSAQSGAEALASEETSEDETSHEQCDPNDGRCRTRTCGHLRVRQALYQLS